LTVSSTLSEGINRSETVSNKIGVKIRIAKNNGFRKTYFHSLQKNNQKVRTNTPSQAIAITHEKNTGVLAF